MKLFNLDAIPGDDLTWRTDITDWEDLPQIAYDYVVHARGVIIEGDIWIDHYNLMINHDIWWDQSLSEEYDAKGLKQLESITFSITGSPSVIVHHPQLNEGHGKLKWQLGTMLREMDASDDTMIYWGDAEITVGDIILDS